MYMTTTVQPGQQYHPQEEVQVEDLTNLSFVVGQLQEVSDMHRHHAQHMKKSSSISILESFD